MQNGGAGEREERSAQNVKAKYSLWANDFSWYKFSKDTMSSLLRSKRLHSFCISGAARQAPIYTMMMSASASTTVRRLWSRVRLTESPAFPP